MAQIYSPKQRQSTKRWDYTVSSDDEGWCHPTGYCSGWKDYTEDELDALEKSGNDGMREWYGEMLPFKEHYHSTGHASAEEACACYRAYELDLDLRLDVKARDEQRKCAACGVWTQGMASLGSFRRWPLCDEHRTRGQVEALLQVSDASGDG